MSRSSVQHFSPSQSVTHLAIRHEVECAGFDVEILRNLLWLVNAHDQLIAFPFLCQNLTEILSVSTKEWGVTLNDFCFHEDTFRLLDWVVTETPKLPSSLGPMFARTPKHTSDNPVMGRGVTRHPTYAALCNTHSSDQLKKKFRLLQGHLLFAQANELHSRNNRIDYEAYDGQNPWKGLPNSPALGCLAVRELSLAQFSDTLLLLSVELAPANFARSLDRLPLTDSSDLTEHLKGLRSFLQKANGIREWVNRQNSGKGDGGGGDRVHGHVQISNQVHQNEIDVGDVDDADCNWGGMVLVTSISPPVEEQQELLSSDLFPDEYDSENLLLAENDNPSGNSGGIAANSSTQLRHVLMSNQLFPWAYQNLTITEVSSALTICSDWVNQIFFKNPSQPYSDQDLKKLETICLMRIMIFTGSNIDRARELLILPRGKEGEDGVLALIANEKGEQEWRVRAIRPDYKTIQTTKDGSDRKKADYFTLPDIGITFRYLELLTKHYKKNDASSNSNYRIFRSRLSTLSENLKKLLSEIDPSERLTISKLSKFLFSRILAKSDGDVCAASLICGEEHRLAHVRLFYSMIPIEQLQQVYIQAAEEIVLQHFAASGKTNKLDAPSLNIIKDKYVGSRLCPTLDSVKIAIKRISDEIDFKANSKERVAAHNLSTLLTIWHFTFSTACRAIEMPYLPLSEVDMETGIALLSDKDDGTRYKSRLIWLTPNVLRRMEQHQNYQSKLLTQYPHLYTTDFPPVFFMDLSRVGNLKHVDARPKSMELLMQPFLPYPANFHRRFMRTELLSNGCATEVVDAYMGHWSQGEEPWSTFSSFTFQQYRNEMEKYLNPLMDEIGLSDPFNPHILPLFNQHIADLP